MNALKEKKLTNVRASGTDENIQLSGAMIMTLEQALEFIDDDELVEITPENIRVRKLLLKKASVSALNLSIPLPMSAQRFILV